MRQTQVIILICAILLLTGCWDQNELEEMAFVIAIGLDKAENGKVKATFQVANPEVNTSLAGGSPPEEPPASVVTIEATDFLTARNTVNAFSTRKLTFSQAMVLVVSEELARTDEFIKIIYSSIREPELRKQIALVISKEKAEDFINKLNPILETRPHKYYSLMIDRVQRTALVPKSDLLKFFQTTESDADLFLAMYATTEEKKKSGPAVHEDEFTAGEIPKTGGPNAQFIGSAVFRQGKMIGTINGEQTRFSMLLNPEERTDLVLSTYPDPLKKNSRIAVRIKAQKVPKIKMNLTKPSPKIQVTVPINVEILAIPSLINYATNEKNQELLRRAIEESLTEKLNKFAQYCQEEFKLEPFRWSIVAQTNFLTIDQYEQFDWMKTYPSMDININSEVTIVDFGQQIQSPNLKVVED